MEGNKETREIEIEPKPILGEVISNDGDDVEVRVFKSEDIKVLWDKENKKIEITNNSQENNNQEFNNQNIEIIKGEEIKIHKEQKGLLNENFVVITVPKFVKEIEFQNIDKFKKIMLPEVIGIDINNCDNLKEVEIVEIKKDRVIKDLEIKNCKDFVKLINNQDIKINFININGCSNYETDQNFKQLKKYCLRELKIKGCNGKDKDFETKRSLIDYLKNFSEAQNRNNFGKKNRDFH